MIWKVTSIALFWVQAVFCAISGSRDISKTKWDIIFEKLEILSNLAEIFTRKYWPCHIKKIPEPRQPKLTKYHLWITGKENYAKSIYFLTKNNLFVQGAFFASTILIQYFVFLKSDTPFSENTKKVSLFWMLSKSYS